MPLVIFLAILLSISSIDCSSVPFIRNVHLVPRQQWNTSIVSNYTVQQCLCLSASSFIAFNWYPNKTCQLFYTFPIRYIIQSMQYARLYFPQRIFPNASQCCTPDTRLLVDKLNTSSRISYNTSSPRCLTFDNHGYLVTVSDTQRKIIRLYPNNLTIVAQPIPPTFTANPNSITYYDEEYFVGFNRFLLVLNSNNFTILQNITAPTFNGIRDMGFLNNGQTLLVLSTSSGSLIFFNRSDNYRIFNTKTVNYSSPHGLHIVNDSFFYIASWNENSIFSYSRINQSVLWSEQLFINARSIAPSLEGAHLSFDDCDRLWFSSGNNGILFFDSEGSFLQHIIRLSLFTFDTVITENYVLYISDMANNQIIRIDPNIQC